MLSDALAQRKKWDELASAASKETDPDKVAVIAEEIFAALEERERTLYPIKAPATLAFPWGDFE